ncbi:Bug family tripartite tricarboxylate transporter substrate binding protein [Pelagibacterium sp.]|uniref:Bug family tripartite tricarboxylate transporter substrate binding protein n=1 Tax=Pelagibacterium sp. TaxID=1967288 RepID=UPI003A94DAD7
MYKLVAGAVLAASLIMPTASAAQEFPERTVTVVVPFSAGGGNDTLARFLAEKLSERWSENVVVENQPGAGGTIGSASVANAEADGYTVLFSSSSFVTSAAARSDLPFDALADIQPVGQVGASSLIVVGSNDLPFDDMSGLAEAAKTRTVFYANSGGASISTFAAELFADIAEVELRAVNYSGASEMLLDITAGRVDVMFGTPASLIGAVQDGRVKALAVLGPERLPELPDTPTIAEAGYPGGEFSSWWGVFAPAGTPETVLSEFNAAINEIMNSPDGVDILGSVAAVPVSASVEEFSSLIVDSLDRLKALAVDRGLIDG